MNSTDIEAFWAVLQYGTMTAAAESLYITQPTLSNRIKALEREIGVTLFNRGKGQGRIELTENGQRFALLAQRWWQLLGEAKELSRSDKHECLRIGAVYTTSQFILPAAYQRFLARNLPITLITNTLQSYGLDGARAVIHHEMDIAFVDSDVVQNENLDLVPIMQEPMVLFCACESSYPELVDVADLDPEREIKIFWQKETADWHERYFGTDTQPLLNSDTLQIVSALPDLKDLWAVVALSAAAQMQRAGHGRICHLKTPPPNRFTYLVSRKGEALSESAQLFLEDLSNVIEQEDGVQLLFGRGILPRPASENRTRGSFDW